MIVNIINLLHFSFMIFTVGIWGIFVVRRNLIIVLLSIELMLLSANINLIVFSVELDDILGQLYALLVLTVAAAESSIGLALLVVYYRIEGIISIDHINSLKG
jgi:NADH-quinone oxidoreductase subunit K